ncbi:O-antigen/teichoic acid export membrane protein [Lacinutrix venerupis]|uniref:oligosaccharide flippase family protein n=1 Tax=Lacinutrix venerupis TaxID=1486034 RepID=UPI000EB56434|nr:oligosaccharide flippase family protein [Lacinutrix venerupis]RLJ63289.1 O-antigen/teichoic acid export membrane protein [Lacinutrix venerupis]
MFRKIISFGAIEGGAKILNIVMMLVLPFFISTEFYGEISIIISIQNLMVSLMVFGLDKAILRLYPDFKNNIFWASFIRLWVKIIMILFPIYILGFLFWKGSISYLFISLLLFVTVLLQCTRQLNIALFKVNQDVKSFFRLRFLVQFAIFVLVIIALKTNESINSYLFAYLIALIPFILFLYRGKKKSLYKKEKTLEVQIFNFSWPLVFHTLGTVILMSVDRLMLDYYLSKHDVAVYSFGYTIGASITFVYAILNAYFEPRLIKSSEEKSLKEKVLNSYTSVLFIFGIILAVIIIGIAPVIIENFYNTIYLESIPIISIIILTHLINPIYLQSNFRLMNLKKTRIIAFSTFLSGFFNIVLNALFLENGYGIAGAAYATFISYLFLSIVIYFLSLKNQKGLKTIQSVSFVIISISLLTVGLIFVDSKLSLILLLLILALIHLFNVKGLKYND